MSNRKLAVHYFIRAGLLAFFAYYILHLVKQGTLILYIAPRMEIYVKAAAIGFYVLAVLQIYTAFRTWWGDQKGDCDCTDCSHIPSSRAGTGMFYLLFAVPLLMGLLLPDAALNSNLAAKKGVSLTGANIQKDNVALAAAKKGDPAAVPVPAASDAAVTQSASPTAQQPASADSLDALFPHDQYSEDLAKLGKKLYKLDAISIQEKGFMESISSLDFYMNNFIGKKVEISGFVYRENDMKETQFVVARFAVQCCSADSSPYGLMVESAMGKGLKKDTWVKITGTLGKTTYAGNEILKIDAAKIVSIPAPKSPYTYPDFEFYEKGP